MKLLLVYGFIAAVVADRLDNTYLPPSNARSAGGNDAFLNTPFGRGSGSGIGSGATSKNYLPPTSGSRGFLGGQGNVAKGNFRSTGFGQNPSNFGVSSGFGSHGSGSSGTFVSNTGSFGPSTGTTRLGVNVHGASANFGRNTGFGQKSNGFGPATGFGSHISRATGASHSNRGLSHTSTGLHGSASGAVGSASGFHPNSGSFGSSSGFGSNARFGQKPNSAFKSSGVRNNAAIGQYQSTQYGRPSAAYVVPTEASARFGGAQSREASAAILRSNNENFGDGSYRYDFETENKISRNEAGELKNVGSDYESSSVHGSYTYTGDDGRSYAVNYIADENGFQPIGDHLPTPPPVPEAIQRSLTKSSQPGSSLGGHSSEFQGNGARFQTANRQYLAPVKPSFNSETGYQY